MSIIPDIGNLQLDVKIFCDVKYYTSGNVSEQIIRLLEDGGAQRLKYFSDFVSHVICGSSGVRESDLTDADDIYEIPAVGERWVLTCARSKTLVNTKGFLYSDNNLFSSLVVTTSGLLPHDRNAIWAMVTYNGGVFKGTLDGVTHLICTSVKCPKYNQSTASGQVTVVTPDWVVECLKAKELVAHEQYHPRRMIPLKQHSDTSRITGFEAEGEDGEPQVEVAKKLAMDKLKNHMPWNQQSQNMSQLSQQLGQGQQTMDTSQMDSSQEIEEEEAKQQENFRKLWKQMPWNQKILGDPRSATSPPKRSLGPPASPAPGRVTPASTPGLTPMRSTTPNSYQYVQSPQQQQQLQGMLQSPQGTLQGQMMASPQGSQGIQGQGQQLMSPQGQGPGPQIMQSPQHNILQSPQHTMPSPQQTPGPQTNENSFLFKYIEQQKGQGQQGQSVQGQLVQQQSVQGQMVQQQTVQGQMVQQQSIQGQMVQQQSGQGQIMQQQSGQAQMVQQQSGQGQIIQQQSGQGQISQQQSGQGQMQPGQQMQQLQMSQQGSQGQQTQNAAFLQQLRQRQQQKQAQLLQQQGIQQIQQGLQQGLQQVPQGIQQGIPQAVQGQGQQSQQVQMQQLQQQQLQLQQPQMLQQPGKMQQMRVPDLTPQQQQQIQMFPSGQRVLIHPSQHQMLLQHQQQKLLSQQQMNQQQQVTSQSQMQIPQSPTQQSQNILQQNLMVQQGQQLQQGMIQQKMLPQQMFLQQQQQQQTPIQQQQVLMQGQQIQQGIPQGMPQNILPQTTQQGMTQIVQQDSDMMQITNVSQAQIQQPNGQSQGMIQQQIMQPGMIQQQQQPQQGLMQQGIQQGMLQQQIPVSMQQQQQTVVSQHQHQLMSTPPQQIMQQQVVQGQVQQPNMTPPQQLIQSPTMQKVSILQQQQIQLGMGQQNMLPQQVVMSQQQQQPTQNQPPNLVMSQQQPQGNLIMGQQFNKVQFTQPQQVQTVPQGPASVQGQVQGQFIKQGSFPQFVQQQQQQGQGQITQQAQGQFIQGVQNVQGMQSVVQTQGQQFPQQQVQVTGQMTAGQQQIITQSPTQQTSGGPAGNPMWQQQVIRQAVPGGPTGTRVQWSGGQHPPRQVIHLDARTHQQLQQMAPEERAQFIHSLRKQRALEQRQQLIQIHNQRAPGGQIVLRGQVPPGLTPQQHVQWLQQQHKQGVVLQQAVQGQQPGLSPIQQPGVGPQVPQGPVQGPPQGAAFDQAQIRPPMRVHQLQLQREQVQAQAQAQNQLPGNKPMHQPPVQAGQTPSQGILQPQGQTQSPSQPGPGPGQAQLDGTQFTRGKTALANMLSIKLSGAQTMPGPGENLPEPSAAGTLRLMTAQHNAALNSNNARAHEILALQQQGQPQRRQGNFPIGEAFKPAGVPGNMSTVATGNQTPGTPTGQGVPQDKMFSPRSVLPIQHRPGTFYGHNPNLKLPPELFLLGCIFVVVEIEDFLNEEVPDWSRIIAKYGGEIEKQYCARITHVLCKSQRHGVVMQALRDFKRCVTFHWLNDVIDRGQVLPPWMALHLPAMNLDSNPASKHLISLSGFTGVDRERIKTMIESIGAACTLYFSNHNTLLVVAKQEGPKFNYAKKWSIPVVNVQWLTEVMLGNFSALNQTEHVKYQHFGEQANFCFDPSLVPTLMQAWKMPINISQESYERVKRSASPVSLPKNKKIKTEQADSTGTEKPEKNVRDEGTLNATHRVYLSKRCSNIQELKEIVLSLGGSTTSDLDKANYLVVSKLYLTRSLLLSICKNIRIVTEAWLHESRFAHQFVEETPYVPDAKEFNQTYGCDFHLTLGTANRYRLLDGREFFLTPSVVQRQAFVDFIKAAGGVVENIRRASGKIEMTQVSAPYSYVIIADAKDLHLVGDLLKKQNKIVCHKEIVSQAILSQTFEIEPFLLTN